MRPNAEPSADPGSNAAGRLHMPATTQARATCRLDPDRMLPGYRDIADQARFRR